jgi:prefoldin alpha subunit
MSAQGAVVDVMQLPPADLQKLRTSLTEDVQTITSNYGNLKLAHSKYAQALDALVDITPENQDKRIMVPLTSSLYVPGQLSNIQTVLVDVGTGYFVEKDIASARVFINGKMELIQGNLQKVAGALSGKRRDLDAVSSILQQKLQIQYQQQAQAMQKIDTLQ